MKRHIEKSCKKIDSQEDESNVPIEASEVVDSKPDTIQIGNNNDISNNININITKSFDVHWDTSGIDINKKFSLLFANSKFTKLLKIK